MPRSQHAEPHYSSRNNWLRASVLGANDGLISTASLLVGVAAAENDLGILLLTGIAAVVAGAEATGAEAGAGAGASCEQALKLRAAAAIKDR